MNGVNRRRRWREEGRKAVGPITITRVCVGEKEMNS